MMAHYVEEDGTVSLITTTSEIVALRLELEGVKLELDALKTKLAEAEEQADALEMGYRGFP